MRAFRWYPGIQNWHYGSLANLFYVGPHGRANPAVAELQSYVSFLENSSVGSRSGAVSVVTWDKTGQKLGNCDKKWRKVLPTKKFTTFSRLKINVDYDFAIKHDLI